MTAVVPPGAGKGAPYRATHVPHYHVYIAGDQPGRKGAPRAFLKRGRYAYTSRPAAWRASVRLEPDSNLRMVMACRNPDCKVYPKTGNRGRGLNE